MNIALHIEKLVLDGLPVSTGQGPAFQAAIETELTRLLAERGMENISGGAVPHLSVAAVQLAAGVQPAQWGRQIARSLYEGLAPAPAQPPRRTQSLPSPPPSQPVPHSSANAGRSNR